MSKINKSHILFAIENLLIAQEQASLNHAYGQLRDTSFLSIRDENRRKVQFHLALLADSLNIKRSEMPFLHSDYWQKEIDIY